MKKVLLFAVVVFCSGLLLPRGASAQGDVYVSYQSFYDQLSPYGQWINDPQYGYVWVPNVDDDFRPYFTGGHWVYTEFGNTWVSDYPWGWACFHYGRWTYNDYYGWLWVPGSEWGPGWVTWRWGGGYCGWAPLYPGFAWAGGVYSCPDDWWIFMHPRYLYRPRYVNIWRSDFVRGPRHTEAILHRTDMVANTYENNNIKYYSGPRATEVQQVTHHPVQVYHLGNAPVRGADMISGSTVDIYRPSRVEQLNKDGQRPLPTQVMNAPQPLKNPEQVKVKWDQPRPFKQTIQQQNPKWERPFVRNEPPYDPHPNPSAQPGRQQSAPVRQQPMQPQRPMPQQPRPQPRPSAPAPRHR